MVVRRRGVLMGVVAVAAFVVATLYAVRFVTVGGLVPFLVSGVLLVVAVVHAMSWSGSRVPLLIADMTGIRLRLGGEWTGLTWGDVEHLELLPASRWGDGRLTVVAVDERRALEGVGLPGRAALAINRWLYDSPLVATFGITTSASVDDIEHTLSRLADGRVRVDTVERGAGRTAVTAGDAVETDVDAGPVRVRPSTPPEAEKPPKLPRPSRPSRGAGIPLSGPGRAVVSALRGLSIGRGGAVSSPVGGEPVTIGSLALSQPYEVETEPLPELEELRRVAPEHVEQSEQAELVDLPESEDTVAIPLADPLADPLTEPLARTDMPVAPLVDPAFARPSHDEVFDQMATDVELEARPNRTANVELVLDAPAGVQSRVARRLRERQAEQSDRASESDQTRESDQTAPKEPRAQRTWRRGSTAAGLDEAVVDIAPVAPRVDPRTAMALRLGEELAEARQRIGASVDDLAGRTRIRPPVIEAIERGDFGPCGGDFYARGHLRMLAGVLGLDPTPLVSRYDAVVAGEPVSPRAVFDAELATGVVRPEGRGARWGALIATVLVLLLAWGVARYVAGDFSHGSSNSPGSSAGLRHGPGGGAGSPLLAGSAMSVTIEARGGASQVVVRDAARTVLFTGVVSPGHSQVVSGPGPLTVTAAHASVVSVATPGHPAVPIASSQGSASRAFS